MSVTEGNCSCTFAPCAHDAARNPSLKSLVKTARKPSTESRPVIVGESNPFGGDEYYAMFPEPRGCAGDRLCRLVMGLQPDTYLKAFERVNLLRGNRWSAPAARQAAQDLLLRVESEPGLAPILILLGKKVTAAFKSLSFQPAIDRDPPYGIVGYRSRYLVLPHPSGRNRVWDKKMLLACRSFLAPYFPYIPFGELSR